MTATQVGSREGPSAIIRAMAAFPSDSELQGEACTAVTNLSHNCDRNRRLVVEGGGLILILNAMQVSTASTIAPPPSARGLPERNGGIACRKLLQGNTSGREDDIIVKPRRKVCYIAA